MCGCCAFGGCSAVQGVSGVRVDIRSSLLRSKQCTEGHMLGARMRAVAGGLRPGLVRPGHGRLASRWACTAAYPPPLRIVCCSAAMPQLPRRAMHAAAMNPSRGQECCHVCAAVLTERPPLPSAASARQTLPCAPCHRRLHARMRACMDVPPVQGGRPAPMPGVVAWCEHALHTGPLAMERHALVQVRPRPGSQHDAHLLQPWEQQHQPHTTEQQRSLAHQRYPEACIEHEEMSVPMLASC